MANNSLPVDHPPTNPSSRSFLDDDSDSSSLSSAPSSPRAPPGFYPSPPPSQDADETRADQCQDYLAPARKRRRVGPKERTTQHLDLSNPDAITCSEQQSQIDLLNKTIREHRNIVVIAGAGISTSAGSKSSTETSPTAQSSEPLSNLL